MSYPDTLEQVNDGRLKAHLRGELTAAELRASITGREPYRMTPDGRLEVIPEQEYRELVGLPRVFTTMKGPVQGDGGPVDDDERESRASAPVYPWAISVMINVHNEGPRLRETLRDFRANFGTNEVEYIVVDDGSDDGCCDDLGDDVTVLRNDRRLGCAKCKRRAADVANGRMFMFCDAHHAMLKGYLSRLAIEAERLQGIVCPAIGRIDYDENWHAYRSSDLLAVPREGGYWKGGIYEWTRATPCGVRKVDTVGCVTVMPRGVYVRLGGWMDFAGTYGMQEYGMSIRAQAAGVDVWLKACVVVGHHWRTEFPYQAPPYAHMAINEWHMWRVPFSDDTFHEYVKPWLGNKPGAKQGIAALALPDCVRDAEKFRCENCRFSDSELLDRLHIPHDEVPIRVAVPYRLDGNLGAAYNSIVESATEEWVLLLDHDVMMLSPNWYRQVQFAARALRASAGIITCWTNRISCPGQKHMAAPAGDDIREHARFAEALWKQHRWSLSPLDGRTLASGMVMLVNRTVWKAVGPFADGFLGVDNEWDQRARKAGFRPYRSDGLYCYHAKITTGMVFCGREVPQGRAM